MQETKLMTSGDESIVLTSHRLIEKNENSSKEVALNDIQSIKLIRKRQRYFVVLFLIFACLTMIEIVGLMIYHASMKPEQHGDWQTMFMFTLVLLGLTTYFTFFKGISTLVIQTNKGRVEMNMEVFYSDDRKKFFTRLQSLIKK